MAACKAQALVANLVIMDADPDTDRAALGKLAIWMQRHFAPIVAADTDGLMLDITGVEGRVQREGLVVHIVADKLTDQLACIGDQDNVIIPHGRGDNFRG